MFARKEIAQVILQDTSRRYAKSGRLPNMDEQVVDKLMSAEKSESTKKILVLGRRRVRRIAAGLPTHF